MAVRIMVSFHNLVGRERLEGLRTFAPLGRCPPMWLYSYSLILYRSSIDACMVSVDRSGTGCRRFYGQVSAKARGKILRLAPLRQYFFALLARISPLATVLDTGPPKYASRCDDPSEELKSSLVKAGRKSTLKTDEGRNTASRCTTRCVCPRVTCSCADRCRGPEAATLLIGTPIVFVERSWE